MLLATEVDEGVHSVYTRAIFDITNVLEVEDLWLGADYDDGYVVWINGTEVRSVIGSPAPMAAIIDCSTR